MTKSKESSASESRKPGSRDKHWFDELWDRLWLEQGLPVVDLRAELRQAVLQRERASALTFDDLRCANLARLPEFKNAHGAPAHANPDGSDWRLSAWSNAVGGEVGEMVEALTRLIVAQGQAANRIKKVERGDLTLKEARRALAQEFADVVIYLDILAYRAGVDLGRAVVAKWNETSMKIGSPRRMGGVVTPRSQCRATVASRPMWENRPCRLPAVVQSRDGRWWCRKHGPRPRP